MSNVTVLPPPTGRPLARASEHLAAGRLAEAAGAFKAVLQIDPHESQAHFGLAQCAVGRGQHDVAYEHFLRTAQLLREREAFDDALTCYGYAVSSDPRRIDIHVDIAELEMELGRREAALARLDGLAEAYLVAEREDDAVAILEFMNELQAGDDPEADTDVEPTASAVQMFEPGAFEAGAIPEPVRDVEGTMMISTFLLTPDGTPFVPGAPPPLMVGEPRSASRITEVPTAAPRASVVPTAAPRATVIPTAAPRPTVAPTAAARATVITTAAPRTTVIPTMGTPSPVVDDPSASEPIRAHAEALDASATRRSSNPLPAIVSAVLDEDSAELAMLAVADLDALDVGGVEDPEIDATAVRAKPLPKAAPAPSSVDAQGRSLAERLRTTRARAATAPQPIVPAPGRSPEPARAAVRVAPPIGAGTSVDRTATASKPVASQPPRTSASPSASKPTGASKPASTGRPSAASPAASKPAASTPGRASTASARPSVPAKPAVSTRAVPAASRPTSAPRPGATTRPPSNGARPGASAPTPSRPSPQTTSASKPAVARPTAAPRSPANGATRTPTPATSSRPAASTRAAAPSGGPTRASVPTRASTTAGRNPGAQRPASAASEPEPRGDASKRVMAVRTRAPAPTAGVPTAVGPSRTLPMVIPPPPREEFDDQNTVIFRGES